LENKYTIRFKLPPKEIIAASFTTFWCKSFLI